MNETRTNKVERRRQLRVAFVANAVVYWDERRSMGCFEVMDISASGALLSGSAPVETGTKVDVTLHLPQGQSVRTPALVVRKGREKRGYNFALAFALLSPEDEKAVTRAVQSSLDEARTAPILVVDDSWDICRTLKQRIDRMGIQSVAVRTPLEAVHVLEQPNKVSVALVDAMLAPTPGIDLFVYLANRHPKVKRVLLSDGGPAQASVPPHGVLAKACKAAELAAAIRI